MDIARSRQIVPADVRIFDSKSGVGIQTALHPRGKLPRIRRRKPAGRLKNGVRHAGKRGGEGSGEAQSKGLSCCAARRVLFESLYPIQLKSAVQKGQWIAVVEQPEARPEYVPAVIVRMPREAQARTPVVRGRW